LYCQLFFVFWLPLWKLFFLIITLFRNCQFQTSIYLIDVINKMNCELMLTYDTPALRQTGSRNLTFYTHWTYMLIFRRIFLSNYWWQKSDIWSQASYRCTILWVAFLDPSDSYFMFADFVDFNMVRLGMSFYKIMCSNVDFGSRSNDFRGFSSSSVSLSGNYPWSSYYFFQIEYKI
jgi:hypothetical protein